MCENNNSTKGDKILKMKKNSNDKHYITGLTYSKSDTKSVLKAIKSINEKHKNMMDRLAK